MKRLLTAIALLVAAPAPGQIVIPDIYVEVTQSSPEQMSMMCTPSGGGDAFTAARSATGAVVDATIMMRLFERTSGPIPSFPAEDLWLWSSGGDFNVCPGGTIADADTDAAGYTTWTQPLLAGGRLDTGAGDVLFVVVNGAILDTVDNMSFNSPDMNGDLAVDMSDVVEFAQHYLAGGTYRTDLEHDGLTNLSDVVRLSQALGSACP